MSLEYLDISKVRRQSARRDGRLGDFPRTEQFSTLDTYRLYLLTFLNLAIRRTARSAAAQRARSGRI
jgi:hypothetical protein